LLFSRFLLDGACAGQAKKKATRQNKKPSKSSELTLIAVAPTKYLEESMQ
jgi:hypothetical protein